MSYEQKAIDALREQAMEAQSGLSVYVARAGEAMANTLKARDLMDMLRAINAMSLACEMLATIADDVHRAADAALILAFEQTGCGSLTTEHHTVSARRNPSRIDVVDRNAVPAEMMTTPAPIPDKAKIRAYLKAHPDTNWAVVREGVVSLQRRSNT